MMEVETETIILRQFLHFFQDFINLCRKQNWPNNNTTPEDIRNAFLTSQHIEKCLDKFQKRSLLDEFLSILNDTEDTSCLFVKKCLSAPPNYVLKKIINSSADISIVDLGFTIFLELYSEEKLQECLYTLMLEAASKKTLLQALKTKVSTNNNLYFKAIYLLTAVKNKNRTSRGIELILNKREYKDIELLIACMMCEDPEYKKGVDVIVQTFINFIRSTSPSMAEFWKIFFAMNEDIILDLCVKHKDIFKTVATALLDVGECIRNEISLDYFYIELSYYELARLVKLFSDHNEDLKLIFLDIVAEQNYDSEFWNKLIDY